MIHHYDFDLFVIGGGSAILVKDDHELKQHLLRVALKGAEFSPAADAPPLAPDAFASIVSNNLNNVMRIFTIISITLSIPTLIFSMYGMNFDGGMMGMPFTDKPWGFMLIIVISMVLSGAVAWFLTRSRMFK